MPIVINGVKHLEGGDLLEGEFSFIVTPNRNNSASDIISKAETVQNDALGNITFLDGRYNEVGTYSYEINEVVPPDDDSIKYDLNKYNVTITVSILDGKVDKKVAITSNNENKQKIEFINFVKSIEVNLDGKKEFKGGTLKGDDFTFEIIPQEDNPSDDPVKQTTTLNDDLGNIPLIHTTYTKTGLYKYQVKEVVGKTRNIKYDNNVYEVEVLIENDDNGLLKSTVTIKNGEDEVDALTFTNIKTTDSPKTLDDIVKYFIILVSAVVMIGGAIIVYRKNIR